ncbi:pyridoxal phosphate-dependent aminotransferase [Desulfosarcina sp. OttesenSCG-928-A07]|nr:pyridoxal phosphate-dependent aminotransferase [Desulfosarcina sp. OttesenSCG-928-A07]
MSVSSRIFSQYPAGFRGSTRFDWNAAPHPLALSALSQAAAGKPVIDLLCTNPTRCGFHYPENTLCTALSDPAALLYRPDPRGLLTARKAVSAYYRDFKQQVSPERVLITTGTSEAYGLIFKLLADPGDEVLIPRPGYPLISHLAGFEGIFCHAYPLRHTEAHGWRIDLEILSALITGKTRAVVVVSPNNPTGNYIHPDDLEQVDTLCRIHGLALIVDEVFSDFPARSSKTSLCTTVNQTTALTFILNGFSKILGLPQMKLGWVVTGGDPSLADAAVNHLETLMDFYLTVATPIQLAAGTMLAERAGIQHQINARIADNENLLKTRLEGVSNIHPLTREGGWYAVVYIDDDREDDERALLLLEKDQVQIHPGRFYQFDRDGFVVMSLISPPDDFSRGISRIIRRFGKSPT